MKPSLCGSHIVLVLVVVLDATAACAQYTTLELIQQRGVITFGVDPNNLPFSSSTNQPPGFDIEIAQKIADHLGVRFQSVWVRSQHPSYPSQLMKKRCDALIGVSAASMADEKGMAFTMPYYRTGFLAAVRKGEREPKGPAGVERGVVIEKLKSLNPREYGSQSAILVAVHKGEIGTGYVGAVPGGWLLKNHPEWNLEFLAAKPLEDHWDVVIAVCKADPELRAALDKAIQQMLDHNEIAPIFQQYGIPFYPPR